MCYTVNRSTDLKYVYTFGNCDQRGSFAVVQCVRHFCSLTPKTGLKSAYRGHRVTQMADYTV